MQKYFYPIFKLPDEYEKDFKKHSLPLWVKWWLLGKSARELSQILTGSSFILTNTVKRRFKKFVVGGNTEQTQYEGKNLAVLDVITLPSSNEIICDFGEGRTFTKLSITLICNNNSFLYPSAAFLGITDENDNLSYLTLSTLQFSSSPATGIGRYMYENKTIKSIKLLNYGRLTGSIKLQVEDGEPTDFEPYCGGIPAPNPDYPQPIKNVTGNTNVKIQNKNLLNINSNRITNKGVTLTIEGTHLTIKGTALQDYPFDRTTMPLVLKNEIPAGTYTFSVTGEYAGTATKSVNYELYDKNNNKMVDFALTPSNISNTFTVDKPIKTIRFFRNMLTGVTIDFDLYLQLELGTTASPYVEHEEQNYPFTFAEGQRGMQGTKLLDDGIHNIMKRYVITGNENWVMFNNKCVRIEKNDVKGNEISVVGNIKCNYLIGNSQENLQLGNVDYGISTRTRSIKGIVIRIKECTTLEEYIQWFKQLYNNGTPLIVEYELEEEEIIPYNATQQAQYNTMKQAKTYKDMTIIETSSDELPPILTIQYWKEKGTEDILQLNYVNQEDNPNKVEFIEDDTLIPEDSISLDEIENEKSFLDFVEEIGDIEEINMESEENENESN